MSDSGTSCAPFPFTGKTFFEIFEGCIVKTAVVPFIPKAKNGENTIFARLIGKIANAFNIRSIIFSLSTLKAVDREVHLIDTRGDKLVPTAIKKSSVCCNGTLKTHGGGISYKVGQKRMGKRLAHYVKIYVIGKPYKALCDKVKLLTAHSPVLPGCAGTKGAASVTYISYLNVYS